MRRPTLAPACALLLAPLCACPPEAAVEDARGWAAPAQEHAWQGCPAPSGQPAGDGPLWLQLGIDNVRCGLDAVQEDIRDDFARKAQLHLVPGDHFVPLGAGTYALDLPVCARLEDEVLSSSSSPQGSLTVTRSEVLGQPFARLSYERPLKDADDAPWTFRLDVEGYLEELEPGLLIDERAWPGTSPQLRTYLCRGEACDESDDVRIFDACQPDGLARERHHFTFEGGTLAVELLADPSEWVFKGRPLRAVGTLNGRSFYIDGYWDLVARPTWPWDAARELGVRFLEPIDDVCGLVIHRAWPYRNAAWDTEVQDLTCSGALRPRVLVTADWEPASDEQEAP